MVKFTLDTVEGEEVDVKMPDYLPARIGMKARSKLQIGVSDVQGDKANVEIENVAEKADEAFSYMVEEMLDRSDTDLEVDDLAMHSYQEVAEYYHPQLQGEKVKN